MLQAVNSKQSTTIARLAAKMQARSTCAFWQGHNSTWLLHPRSRPPVKLWPVHTMCPSQSIVQETAGTSSSARTTTTPESPSPRAVSEVVTTTPLAPPLPSTNSHVVLRTLSSSPEKIFLPDFHGRFVPASSSPNSPFDCSTTVYTLEEKPSSFPGVDTKPNPVGRRTRPPTCSLADILRRAPDHGKEYKTGAALPRDSNTQYV
jgi:hypothetical protein